MTPAIQQTVTNAAQAMEATDLGWSHGYSWARKHKGMIQQMKGWRKVTLSTFMKRSTESGANQLSRWGGRE